MKCSCGHPLPLVKPRQGQLCPKCGARLFYRSPEPISEAVKRFIVKYGVKRS